MLNGISQMLFLRTRILCLLMVIPTRSMDTFKRLTLTYSKAGNMMYMVLHHMCMRILGSTLRIWLVFRRSFRLSLYLITCIMLGMIGRNQSKFRITKSMMFSNKMQTLISNNNPSPLISQDPLLNISELMALMSS
jgi:hypothetical protein